MECTDTLTRGGGDTVVVHVQYVYCHINSGTYALYYIELTRDTVTYGAKVCMPEHVCQDIRKVRVTLDFRMSA